MPLLLDFESRSDADLKAIGGRKYWEHPSTEALCCVAYDTDDGALLTWTPGDHSVAGEIARRAELHNWGAHNATGFDRFAMRRTFGIDREDWIDTSELARTAGLPGALDALGTRWLGLPKDKVASAYTKSLSRRSKAEATAGQWLKTPDMDRVINYCTSDVQILAEGWEYLEPWLPLEPDVVQVDRAINDRGIGFDCQLAKRLLEIDAELCDRALLEAARLGGGTRAEVEAAASSPKQFTEHTGLPDAQKQTVDEALALESLPPAGLALCRARRALASIARGKLEAGLLRVSDDGRLRDNLRYYGAHTGRWSGRGMQLQNLPRPEKRFESFTHDDIARLADRVLAGETLPDAAHVDLLLRACLVARPGHTLIVRDFSSIEARALAWIAQDPIALLAFAEGRDLYMAAAAAMFGIPYEQVSKALRHVGKVAELALGYQGGVVALERMARGNGLNLYAPGMPAPKQIVEAWRRSRPAVVLFWQAVQAMFYAAVDGEVSRWLPGGSFEPWPAANGVAVILPQGRPVVYNDVALTENPETGRRGLAYQGTRGTEHIYGGKITENLIQGLARDLMANAMVDAERAGLSVSLTVHDEIVCEVQTRHVAEAIAELDRIMARVPEWARGLPLHASGFEACRYRK